MRFIISNINLSFLSFTNSKLHKGWWRKSYPKKKLISIRKRRKTEEEEQIKLEKEMIIEEKLEETQKFNIKPATYSKLKKQFETRETELRLDIKNIAVRTMFISEGGNGNNRRIYIFYLN